MSRLCPVSCRVRLKRYVLRSEAASFFSGSTASGLIIHVPRLLLEMHFHIPSFTAFSASPHPSHVSVIRLSRLSIHYIAPLPSFPRRLDRFNARLTSSRSPILCSLVAINGIYAQISRETYYCPWRFIPSSCITISNTKARGGEGNEEGKPGSLIGLGLELSMAGPRSTRYGNHRRSYGKLSVCTRITPRKPVTDSVLVTTDNDFQALDYIFYFEGGANPSVPILCGEGKLFL